MQLIEVSYLGARSARFELASQSSPTRVTLFPMVHLGEAAFYETVYTDALDHDAVLVEGVNSSISRRLTRGYRWMAKGKRIDLQVQPRLQASPDHRAVIIHADLSGDEFLAAWLKVPWPLRALFAILTPVVGLYGRWFGTRAGLAQHLPLDDLSSREETLNWDPRQALVTGAMLDVRDRHLIMKLGEILDAVDPPPVERVAVVFGARHMRNVLRELSRRDFHVTNSKWLTVFTVD